MAARGKYTLELVQDICTAIALEGTERSGWKGRISEDTFYTWLKDKAEFSEAVNAAKAEYRQNLPEADRRQARKAFVDYLYGRMERVITKTEYGSSSVGSYEKEIVQRVPVGVPRWAIERVLGKGMPSEIEALVTLVEAGWIPREVLSLAIEQLSQVKKSLREVFEGILPNTGEISPGLSDETAAAIRAQILGIEPPSVAALPAVLDSGSEPD